MQNEIILSNRINYLLVYREKNLLQDVYYSTFVKKNKINYFCNLEDKNKLFKNKSNYKVVKNIKGTFLYINNDFIQNISKGNKLYLKEYDKKILEINNNFIKINHRDMLFNFIISKYSNISDYKLIPFENGVESVKNINISSENHLLIEILRLPDDYICIAYKEPFTYLFSFIIGVSQFIK